MHAGFIGVIVFVALASACGLELGGPSDDPDGGPDGSPQDVRQDIDIPDLGTGENEAGMACVCEPMIPTGWTVVSYSPAMRPNCPSGYATGTDLVEDPTAAASTCNCACNPTPTVAPTCSSGNPAQFSGQWDKDNSCSGNTFSNWPAAPAPGCQMTTKACSDPPGGCDYVKATTSAPMPSGGACAAPSVTTTIPAATASNGRTCNLTAPLGGCASGVCIVNPGPEFSICIAKTGTDPCPSSYPISHLAGTGIADTRSCGQSACGCVVGGTQCSKPTLTFYLLANCTGPSKTITADGTCQQVGYGNAVTLLSLQYSSSASGASCGASGTYTPQGMLGVTSPTRICCR